MQQLKVPSLRAMTAAVLCLALPGLLAAVDNGMKFERDADFSSYESYGWIKHKKRPEGSRLAVGGALDTKLGEVETALT